MSRAAVNQFLTAKGGPAPVPDPFPGALGLWYVDQYVSTPRKRIANANATTAISANLIGAPRRMYTNTEWWTQIGVTITENAAAAPDGTMTAATFAGTGGWVFLAYPSYAFPAGTYTVACSVKRNAGTDQQFALQIDSTKSATKTATSAWQRFSFTLSVGASFGVVAVSSFDGATAANLQICDFELFAGSSDLGPLALDSHLYLGRNAFDPRASYASGALDMSDGSIGLVQLPSATTSLSAFTVQCMVTRLGAGGGGHDTLFSKIQSLSTFSMTTEDAGKPQSYLGADLFALAPAQQTTGLWNAANKGYQIVTWRYDGTNFDYWIGDVRLMRKVAALGAISVADLAQNFMYDTTFPAAHKYAGAMAMWDRALTDAEVRATIPLQQARAALSSITSTPPQRVICPEGDSITWVDISYAYKYGANMLPATTYAMNYANSGDGIAALTARGARLDGVIPTSRGGRKFILSVLVGANDLPGVTMATWLASVAAYCDARRAAGWYVVLCTILPRTLVGFNAARNTANAELRLWTTGGSVVPGIHCNAICDFAAEATMGPDAAASNPTWYPDGVHPSTAGHALLEVVYRAPMNAA